MSVTNINTKCQETAAQFSWAGKKQQSISYFIDSAECSWANDATLFDLRLFYQS